jgi:hypothetical protein
MATQFAQAAQSKVKQGPPINVRVTASKDPAGTVVYSHDWDFGGPVKGGKIEVPKDTPPTNIKFHLTDRTGLNLKFYPSPSAAFYVDFEPTCPKNAGNAKGEFDLNDPPSSSSNNLLTVLDMNKTACDLKYALRFDGDPYTDSNGTHPPYEYDPDLRNGGGGTRANVAALVGVAVMTVIAVTALVWLVRA